MKKRLLCGILFLCSYAAAQTINPNTQIRWSVASGCTSAGLVYSPATGTCISVGAVPGWSGTLTANQGSSDTTASISTINTLPSSGYFFIGSEWEQFFGVTSLGGNNYTLTGIVRGKFATTAASHASSSAANGMILPLGDPSSQAFAWIGGTNTTGYFLSLLCPFGTSVNDTVAFQVGCNGFTIGQSGGLGSNLPSASNYFQGTLKIGVANPGNASDPDVVRVITHNASLVQTGSTAQITQPIGLGGGVGSAVQALQVTAPAPILTPSFIPAGSTTYTYSCQGTDAFGNNIPGTSASLTNLANTGWPTPSGGISGYCPPIPGAVSIAVYRTSGGPDQGEIASGSTAYLSWQDKNTASSGGSPNPTNSTIPAVCTGGTVSAPQYCTISGSTSTPTTTCSSSTAGWTYHNVSATTSPFAYVCNGSSWVTAY